MPITRPRPALATPPSRSGRRLITVLRSDRNDIPTLHNVGHFNFVATCKTLIYLRLFAIIGVVALLMLP
jgi:hypothetical protein